MIERNVIREDNRPNACLEPGGDVCEVRPGTGILVMAADEKLVRNNTVTGNGTYGIAVADICLAQKLPEAVREALDIEANSDNNTIVHNTVTGNGTNPAPKARRFRSRKYLPGGSQAGHNRQQLTV